MAGFSAALRRDSAGAAVSVTGFTVLESAAARAAPHTPASDVKVTRSLDPIFGLDQEAIKAAKMWKFRPGMRQGEPVPVIITIELTFTLR